MLVNKYAPSFRNIFVGIFLLSFSACTQIRSPDVGQHNLSPTTEFAIPDDVYRLKPGDRVSMIVVPKTELVNYRINVGDEINVLVQDREDLSIDYVVNPDGSIQLMQLEPMIVSGITMQELNRKVNLAYQKQGLESYITVGLRKFNTPLNEFIRILTPAGVQNNPFITTLEIDGKANFPLLGQLDIANKTLKEANDFVANKYLSLFDNADITLRIEDSARHTITILGAVREPGSFPIAGTAPLLTVLGAAKGYTDEAQLDSIITVQPRGNKVYVNKFNLEENIVQLTDVKMAPGDTIYVPKKTISDINLFVDQYIRKNIPITTNLPLLLF